MGRRLTVAALATLLLAGCSYPPVRVEAGEGGLPARMGYRQLYRTARAYVYASNEATAGRAGTYIEHQLREIEKRCGVRLDPGLIIVLAPGESLASDRPGSQEPHLPMNPSADLTDADTRLLLGLPPQLKGTYSFCCVLPTDGFLNEAVWRYFSDGDRKYPNGFFLDHNPITRLMYRGFMRPLYALRYVAHGQHQRKYVLAKAAVTHSAMDKEQRRRALAVVQSVYQRRYERAKYDLEHFD